ncbi:hypothetical protein ABH994_005418 [Bradyrhizobium yuanmingense]|uniref:Transposase IS66 central domain-containing protein n=1 Tax=Bradyrhizobium yuanmingense TaxID=108015 RepID=A0ABV4GMN1_9BRAD
MQDCQATIAHVLVSKYADHLPLYRQAQIMNRQGIDLDRSTLADWVGRAAFELRPVFDALLADLKRSTKLFMDETRAPVLDPGSRKTKTGYFWALARDDRPWDGGAPPGIAFTYAPGRGGLHAERILRGFTGGILQVDGYAGYNRLIAPDRVGPNIQLAYCRVGGDVANPAPHRPGRADYPHPVLHAQASLTVRHIGGRS